MSHITDEVGECVCPEHGGQAMSEKCSMCKVSAIAKNGHEYLLDLPAMRAFVSCCSKHKAVDELVEALKKTDALVGGLIMRSGDGSETTLRKWCGYEQALRHAEGRKE